MFAFGCARCGAELAGPLSQVALPVHARQKFGNGAQMPVLMEAGTFAVDSEPSGPPWRLWEEVDPAEAAAGGVHVPLFSLSDSAPGAIAMAPGDIRGTRLTPENGGGACCGLDGRQGPNMVCRTCGLAVATRIDDCSLWQAVWLAPGSVRRFRTPDADAAPLSAHPAPAAGRPRTLAAYRPPRPHAPRVGPPLLTVRHGQQHRAPPPLPGRLHPGEDLRATKGRRRNRGGGSRGAPATARGPRPPAGAPRAKPSSSGPTRPRTAR